MLNKKTIILNGLDVVTNRKMISIKLPVWKKLISCSRHEDITTTKLIDKLISK
jgi:macrodomain Ter protein organizer (MatP/YcbG family)